MGLFDMLMSGSLFHRTCSRCGRDIDSPSKGDVCVCCDEWFCARCIEYKLEDDGMMIPMCPRCYY